MTTPSSCPERHVDSVELHRQARRARAWMIGELIVRAARALARLVRRPSGAAPAPARRGARCNVI
jgi:hypothetical protein